MGFDANSMSPADIAAVTRNNDNGNGNGFFGQDWIWIIILFLFAFCGFGGGGWGGFGNNGGGATPYMTSAATQADIQRGFDNANVVAKLDGLSNGLCDSTYALNNAITNGFHNSTVGMMQGFNGVQSQLCNMQAQNQQCCCETQRLIERGFADTNYNLATQACDTRSLIQSSTRDIIEASNANARAIMDMYTQDKISTLQSENQNLKLAASQANQNAVLMAAMDANKAEILRRTGAECPTAAYIVQPPTPVNFPTNCCGQVQFNSCNSGCGCNNSF